ncbi:18746_t:CDS:1, partial [Gigaspora margarita]
RGTVPAGCSSNHQYSSALKYFIVALTLRVKKNRTVDYTPKKTTTIK